MSSKILEEENLIMGEVLKSLHRMGTPAKRNEIRQEIKENSEIISEEEVEETRISRNGNTYSPFHWRSNFAMSQLVKSGYLKKGEHSTLELTEKGRNVNFELFDPQRDVRKVNERIDQEINKHAQDKEIEQEVSQEEKENSWRQELLDSLQKMNPKKFELFCRGLLTKMGIDVDDTLGVQYVADGGIDGFGYVRSDDYRTTRVALQAKRWQGKVSAPEIDKFRGAMDKFRAEFGIFITNSSFTREAIKTAREGTRIITLIDGEEICNLVAKYNYYVEPVTTYRLKDFYLEDN